MIISKIRCSDKGNDDMKMKFLKEYAKRLTARGEKVLEEKVRQRGNIERLNKHHLILCSGCGIETQKHQHD